MTKLLSVLAEEDSLRRNDSLNPDLWDGESLKPSVRTALLNFAEAWRRYAGIPDGKVTDVLMVGGNAGYYWNGASDIDVHLLVRRSDLGIGPVVDDHLKDRKTLWKIRHDVRVKGYQVEPYAQDVGESSPEGQGVYSIEHDRWIKRPIAGVYDPTQDTDLLKKTIEWRTVIDKALERGADPEEMDLLKDRLADMRSTGIRAGGELNRDNLVFKSLRLSGHLDKMSDYVNDKRTRALSLESIHDET